MPATSLPLLSFTVKGTSTKFVCTMIVKAFGPSPEAGTSGCASVGFVCEEEGSLLGTLSSGDAAVESLLESGVVPMPGLTELAAGRLTCGRGASGIDCCPGVCCACGPSTIRATAPAKKLSRTKHYLQKYGPAAI